MAARNTRRLSWARRNVYVPAVAPADGDVQSGVPEGDGDEQDAEAVAGAIRRALAITPQSAVLASPELQRTVQAFAAAARRSGSSPERMLIDLVRILNGSAPPSGGDWWHSVLRDRLVVWAIEGYYGIDIER